jgi:BRCA1-associated protein
MPFYFYHLKFELYSSSTPASRDFRSSAKSTDEIWLPPSDTDVFSDLPSHHRRSHRTTTSIPASSNPRVWTGRSGPSEANAGASDASVIDCGVPRAPTEKSHSKTERVSERQWLHRTKSSPPPPAGTALGPQTAVGDWRFGRVSIETADPLDMNGETSRAGLPGAAPSLGPMLGGASMMNKAELLHLRTKHTDVGWGVVHFYRDGDETPSLGYMGENAEEGEDASEPVDCTTVCIPAVPAYMSPGDFLGFVGEKWRGDIIHCRMVMTSKMNRYLALLKFRDGDRAKKWRREFDGKVFNTMEVGLEIVHTRFRTHALSSLFPAPDLPCCLRQGHHLRIAR